MTDIIPLLFSDEELCIDPHLDKVLREGCPTLDSNNLTSVLFTHLQTINHPNLIFTTEIRSNDGFFRIKMIIDTVEEIQGKTLRRCVDCLFIEYLSYYDLSKIRIISIKRRIGCFVEKKNVIRAILENLE